MDEDELWSRLCEAKHIDIDRKFREGDARMEKVESKIDKLLYIAITILGTVLLEAVLKYTR